MIHVSREFDLLDVLLNSDTRLLRIFVGAYTALFGLWMLLPPPFSISPVLQAMGSLVPINMFGTAMLVLGTTRIAGAICRPNGHDSNFYLLHSAMTMFVWLFLSVWGYLLSPVSTTIPAVVPLPLNMLLAGTCSWLFFRHLWDRHRA